MDRHNRGRRQVIGLATAGLAGAMAGNVVGAQSNETPKPSATDASALPNYLVVFRPGPRWIAGKPLKEQPLKEHGRYMLDLYRRGILRVAGGFADDSGGALAFRAADDAEARAIVAADPAVISKLFLFELHPWKTQPWAEIDARARQVGR